MSLLFTGSNRVESLQSFWIPTTLRFQIQVRINQPLSDGKLLVYLPPLATLTRSRAGVKPHQVREPNPAADILSHRDRGSSLSSSSEFLYANL